MRALHSIGYYDSVLQTFEMLIYAGVEPNYTIYSIVDMSIAALHRHKSKVDASDVASVIDANDQSSVAQTTEELYGRPAQLVEYDLSKGEEHWQDEAPREEFEDGDQCRSGELHSARTLIVQSSIEGGKS